MGESRGPAVLAQSAKMLRNFCNVLLIKVKVKKISSKRATSRQQPEVYEKPVKVFRVMKHFFQNKEGTRCSRSLLVMPKVQTSGTLY